MHSTKKTIQIRMTMQQGKTCLATSRAPGFTQLVVLIVSCLHYVRPCTNRAAPPQAPPPASLND